jgi:hypothetical protein
VATACVGGGEIIKKTALHINLTTENAVPADFGRAQGRGEIMWLYASAASFAGGTCCRVSRPQLHRSGCVEDVQRHPGAVVDSCRHLHDAQSRGDPVAEEQKACKKQDSTAGCKRSNGDAPRAHAAVVRRRRSVRGSGQA